MSDHAAILPAFSGPLFIIGMPRSGTKLLRDLLNRHPRIRIPDVETEFLPYLIRHRAFSASLRSPARFRELYADLARLTFFQYRRDAGRLIGAEQWHGACRSYDAAGIFEALIRCDTGALDDHTVIWGDKSPSYIAHVELIAKTYPHARFIHIVRDVRDYCLSVHQAWGKHMARAAQRWADDVTRADREGAELGARYLALRYEDLLTDIEGQLRALCRFLDIAFDPAMLSLDRPSENLGNARGSTRVVADNHGHYRHAMAPATLVRVEHLAGDALKRFGYPLACPDVGRGRMSVWEARLAQLADAWQLVLRERRKRGLPRALLFHLRHYLASRP